jgi:CubicO group peptidase (beta-lactamase class C family)
MVLNGGELDGVRLLAPTTVELLAHDHLAALEPDPGIAFGLGFGIAPDPGLSGQSTSTGTLSWSGFYTTRFWIDPEEDFLGVILTQTYPFDSGRALGRLQALAYQAITGPPKASAEAHGHE